MEILDDIHSFLRQKINDDVWYSFLFKRLEKTRKMVHEGYWIPCLDLPSLISLGLKKGASEARLLSIIATFIYLGADLLDDFHDLDLEPTLDNTSPATITLLSATLLTVFPTLVLSELKVSAETKLKMQETIAQTLLKMSIGQQKDISLTHQEQQVSLANVKGLIEAKSGEELALFCLLVAQAANISPAKQALYETFGRFLGTALQMVSDYHEIKWSAFNRDLKQGTRSLPIAFCLEKLKGEDQQKFLELLRTRVWDTVKLNLLRQVLADAGSLDYTALVIEDLCQKSLDLLALLELTKEVEDILRTRIQSVSLLQVQPHPSGLKDEKMIHLTSNERSPYEGFITTN